MYLPDRWLKERGASVLAALVLVAVLGAILVVLQYARSSGDFAYRSASLVAATAATANPSPPSPTGCIKSGADTVCRCNQATVHPAISIGGTSINQDSVTNCLPGCIYDVSPGATADGEATISVDKNSPGYSDPITGTKSACKYRICGVGGANCQLPSANLRPSFGSITTQDLASLNINPLPSITVPMLTTTVTGPSIGSILGGSEYNTPYQAGPSAAPLTADQSALIDSMNAANGNPPATPAVSGNQQLSAMTGGTNGVDPIPTGATGAGAQVPLNPSLYPNAPTSQDYAVNPYQNPTQPCGAVCNNGTSESNLPGTPASPCNGGPCNGGGSGDTFQQTPAPCPTGIPGNCNQVQAPPGSGCSAGQVLQNGVCVSNTSAPPYVPPTVTHDGQAINPGGFNLGNLGGIATSFLAGLAQGLMGNPAANGAQPPGTCQSQYMCRGNTLSYEQNTCVSQPMQQCQYGCNGNACATSPQSSSPYGTGNDGAACPQPMTQPAASTCTIGSWQQQRQSNGCPTAWQCAGNGSSGAQPTAQLSCQPQVADVGMTVSMSYSCGNALHSAGSGFDTRDQLSGSTTTVITTPPSGDNTASFALTCINQTLTASAQCSMQVNQPSIVLIANPSVVPSGTATAIGWVTSGMKSCTISSPDSAAFTAANAGNTSVSGVATTSTLTAPMNVVLNCQTLAGGTRQASASITIGNSGSSGNTTPHPITISSSIDGGTLAHGDAVTITWNSVNPPSGSAMSLWLVNKQTGAANTVVAGGLSASGIYTWNVPALGSTCNPNASNVCASDLVQGGSYAIEAVLYAPSNAYVGDGTAPSNPTQPTYGSSAVAGTFTVSDGSPVGGE